MKEPLPNRIRNMILDMIDNKVPYTKIMEKVESEGYSVSRGGITYIKNNPITEQNTKHTKQKEDQNSENTEQVNEILIEQGNKEKKESIEVQEKRQFSKDFLLSELEFKNLENAFNVIFQSNLKRLQNYRATGILNALNLIKDTIQIIKERGNFK